MGYGNLGVQNQLQGLQLGNGVQQLTLGSSGCGGNLGNVGLGYSNMQSLPYTLEGLSISSGSQYGPGGISVVADNLEIGGQVSVSGSMPFYGAVAINGNVPTSGQGQVQYSSAPGVGLSSGGCGYGLPSSVPNAGLGGSVVSGLSGLGGYGGNVGNVGGLSIGTGTCGCNLY